MNELLRMVEDPSATTRMIEDLGTTFRAVDWGGDVEFELLEPTGNPGRRKRLPGLLRFSARPAPKPVARKPAAPKKSAPRPAPKPIVIAKPAKCPPAALQRAAQRAAQSGKPIRPPARPVDAKTVERLRAELTALRCARARDRGARDALKHWNPNGGMAP